MCDGTIEPLWYENPVLPPQLADILEESVNSEDKTNESDEEDVTIPANMYYPGGDISGSDSN